MLVVKLNVKILCLLLFSIMFYSGFGQKPADTSLVVMTYNIRLNTPDDGVNAWPERKDKVIALMRNQKADIFGLQEVLVDQLRDIEKAFPEYGRIGVGRDDGKEAGEFSPVFFHKERFQLLNSGTFWLSPKPSTPGSRGWDAACNRVVSWGLFKDIKTGKSFGFFNTHFDHEGRMARRNSAFLLMNAVDSIAGKLPSVITGDFNSTPETEPMYIMTGRARPWLLFDDTRKFCPGRTGPSYTYTGFEVGAIPGQLIDYILVKHIKTVLSHTVIDENDGKYYPSDHLPVVARIAF